MLMVAVILVMLLSTAVSQKIINLPIFHRQARFQDSKAVFNPTFLLRDAEQDADLLSLPKQQPGHRL